MRDDDDQSPLDRAFHGMYKDGRFDLVVYLISNGCGDDTKRAIVLAQACHQGRLDVVKELVEQYEVDPKGEFVCFSIQCVIIFLLSSHCLRCEVCQVPPSLSMYGRTQRRDRVFGGEGQL